MFNWIKVLLLSLPRAEQTQREREREREREVCARWTEQTQRERERGVCARWESKTSARAAVPVTMFGRFFEGKKVAKGLCNVAKLATLCISISPTTGWATGQTGNMRCVNRALKKLVPLKWTCLNALTLTALNIYIYIERERENSN